MYMKRGEGEEHAHASVSSRDEIPLSMLIPILTLASLCIVMGILWLSEITVPILNRVNAMFGLAVIR
jgi:NADH:ubiquinone oxidoreductase subunit 5 (subunit L)/multisubunit Na+/H+ antiporter MnhA subunit